MSKNLQPQISWVRNLPEAGSSCRLIVEDEARVLAKIEDLDKLRRRLLTDLAATRREALRIAAESWSAEEIHAAQELA